MLLSANFIFKSPAALKTVGTLLLLLLLLPFNVLAVAIAYANSLLRLPLRPSR